jgi:hypothetical protein
MVLRIVRLLPAAAVAVAASVGAAEAFGPAGRPVAAADEFRPSIGMAVPVHDWRERDRAWLHHRRAIERHHRIAPGGLCVDHQPFTSLSCQTFLRHHALPHGFHQPHHFGRGGHMGRHRGSSTFIIVR